VVAVRPRSRFDRHSLVDRCGKDRVRIAAFTGSVICCSFTQACLMLCLWRRYSVDMDPWETPARIQDTQSCSE
jgi:hypothetical protein